jgi:prevent-host-death family protein
MADQINLYDAKTHLSQLVERASAGEEIIIAKGGLPKARLMPLAPPPRRNLIGSLKGEIHLREDFDEPLPEEIARLFRGEGE